MIIVDILQKRTNDLNFIKLLYFSFLLFGCWSSESEAIQLWFLRSDAVNIFVIWYFFASFFENLCCMHMHKKSWQLSDNLLNILIIVNVYLSLRSDLIEWFLIAWIKQHEDWIFGIFIRNSSLIISSPPVEARVNKMPKSNRSCFFNSFKLWSWEKLFA